MYSLFHIDYDHSQSLRRNCIRLGMFYGSKKAVNRIYRRVKSTGYTLKDIQAFDVLADDIRKLYFRVYFSDCCIEVLNSWVLRGKGR